MPIPTARQLEWQQQELIMFVHFTVNTFTDREWGDGKEDPQIFNPTELDVRQWVDVAAEIGFKTIILTAKHHDGFCLWPSKYTDHSVKSSPWLKGKGDVVGFLADACRERGIKMGLYLSPWDRHESSYGDELRYNLYYLGQLRELLTQYGPVSEVWFDGAKGRDAKDMSYHFDKYWALVRQLQPGAVMFSDAGPDVRWIGNEKGIAGSTCWSMMDRSRVSIGMADTSYLNTGDPEGLDWVPGETDVSIRPGWFWHPNEEPKSLAELIEIYFNSVGRNSVLLLNLPPDRRGLIPEEDVARLREFRKTLDQIFAEDLAAGKVASASNTRGSASLYAPAMVLDGDSQTFWSTDDGLTQGWLEVDLGETRTFNVSRIEEPIALGQRCKQYRVDAHVGGKWQTLVSGTTIGYRRLDRFDTVSARYVRLVIEDSRACPTISGFSLYRKN
ncbi:MAG: alpha-L-fucosidase [Acidobacteriota bacterium]|nr:MAG: alpha-L-fucosidase [Acidobacteriota bacterium]